MSTERDELAEILKGHPVTLGSKPQGLMTGHAQEIADKILAAGYRKPYLLYTVEELDSLPVGSVIRTGGYGGQYAPQIAEKNSRTDDASYWQVAGPEDIDVTSDELNDFPATVLHVGGAE